MLNSKQTKMLILKNRNYHKRLFSFLTKNKEEISYNNVFFTDYRVIGGRRVRCSAKQQIRHNLVFTK